MGMKKKSVIRNTAPEIAPKPSGLRVCVCVYVCEQCNSALHLETLHIVSGGLVHVSPEKVSLDEAVLDG